MATTVAEKNRALLNKKVHDFYVSFFNFRHNEGNILGRQVMSVERPTLTFNEGEVRNKGLRQSYSTTIEYQPITIVFYDDMNSLVNRAVYEQILYQTHVLNADDSLFNVGVKIYSPDEKVVEEFELKRCYIQNITHSEQVIQDSVNNLINVTIAFNDLVYRFPELDFGNETV